MACPTKWTRWTSKLVSPVISPLPFRSPQERNPRSKRERWLILVAELDALGLDDEPIGEGETPSYLQDSQALPDFVDAAPVENEHESSGPTAEVAR